MRGATLAASPDEEPLGALEAEPPDEGEDDDDEALGAEGVE